MKNTSDAKHESRDELSTVQKTGKDYDLALDEPIYLAKKKKKMLHKPW